MRVAVIGCGRWGIHHIRVLKSFPDVTLVSCVDPNKKTIEKLSKIYPEVSFETDYRKILGQKNSIDAVIIAVPTSSHYQVVKDCLLHSKHVLCEKPLCENTVQASHLSQIASKRKLILMVGHVFLFNPAIVRIKDLVCLKSFGKIYTINTVRTNLGPIRNDVNVVYDLASHDISIMNWLLNKMPVCVSATGGSFLQKGIQDISCISLIYPGNVHGHIYVSWLNPKKVRQMTIVGERKMISWDDLELSTPVSVYDRGASLVNESTDYGEFLRLSMWDGDVCLPKVEMDEPLKCQDRYFIDRVHSNRRRMKSDAEMGVSVVRVLEAINDSIKNNGQPVKIKGTV